MALGIPAPRREPVAVGSRGVLTEGAPPPRTAADRAGAAGPAVWDGRSSPGERLRPRSRLRHRSRLRPRSRLRHRSRQPSWTVPLLAAALVVAVGLAASLGLVAGGWRARAPEAGAQQPTLVATTAALEQQVASLQDRLDAAEARVAALAAEKARLVDLQEATALRDAGGGVTGAAARPSGPEGDAAPGPELDPQLDPERLTVRASVRVRTIGCDGVETGSGFAVGAHTVVTNAHVVAGARRVQVDTWDGYPLAVTASVTAAGGDLAVVTTRQRLPAALPLAGVDPAAGAPVTVVGYPRGEALARAGGTVTGEVEDPLGGGAGARVLAVDAAVAPGSSGSAVVDAAGSVVGVVYAGATTGERAYAVPVSVLRAALDAPAAPASASRPAAGSGSC